MKTYKCEKCGRECTYVEMNVTDLGYICDHCRDDDDSCIIGE